MNWFHLFTAILLIAKVGGWVSISWWFVFAPSIFSIVVALLLVGTTVITVYDKFK